MTADYTYQPFLLLDPDTNEVIPNATGGLLLDIDGDGQQVYDLVGTPIASLSTGSKGVGNGFRADVPQGVVTFGSAGLPVVSIEAQSAGLAVLDAVTLAQAAADSANDAQLAAETAAQSVGAVPDAVADAAIDRAITQGRVVGSVSPAFSGTPTGISKAHVGLGNVDNTSDANKPVSVPQRAALNELAYQDTITRPGSYTVQGTDNGIAQSFDSPTPVTLFVPPNLPPRTIIPFCQWGTGQLTVAQSASTSVYASPSVRDESAYVGAALTSHPIPMPAQVQTNDGLLVVISVPSSGRTVTPPADFVEVDAMIGQSGSGMFVYRKVAAPSSDAGASKTFVISSTAIPITAVAISIADAHLTNFIDGFAPTAPNTADLDTAPTYVTTTDNVLELSLRTIASSLVVEGVPAVPSGTSLVVGAATNRADANTSATIASAGIKAVAGTTAGGRAWPLGYGAVRTLGIKGTVTSATTYLRSAGGAFKVAAQYGTGAITVRPDGNVIVEGYMTP